MLFDMLVVQSLTVAASRPDLDVQRCDSQLLAARCDVLGCQHGRVGRGLVSIGLDLHATSYAHNSFAPADSNSVNFSI